MRPACRISHAGTLDPSRAVDETERILKCPRSRKSLPKILRPVNAEKGKHILGPNVGIFMPAEIDRNQPPGQIIEV